MEGGSMKRLVLLVALPAICGCTDRMTVDLHNGTFCNSTNVEAYAEKYDLTYQQALDELRSQSNEMWDREEGRQQAADTDGKRRR
jgi:hypothetical protein